MCGKSSAWVPCELNDAEIGVMKFDQAAKSSQNNSDTFQPAAVTYSSRLKCTLYIILSLMLYYSYYSGSGTAYSEPLHI